MFPLIVLFAGLLLGASPTVAANNTTKVAANCNFIVTSAGVESFSGIHLDQLQEAVSNLAGPGEIVPVATAGEKEHLEKGIIGGRVSFSDANAVESAENLCDKIKKQLAVELARIAPADYEQVSVLSTSVTLPLVTSKGARKTCYWYNWMCYMQCNRGYRTYSTSCCCK